LAYAKAAAGKQINLQAIKRVGKFHSLELTEGFASATALRQELFSLTERQNLLTELSADLATISESPEVVMERL
ncbi:nucleotidyltransferase family protein, partial [Pseudomonas sp. S68]|uniref:nucleotidyltransferase family protein n=1 Tax=Pseudomonas sp. S68 TaxID=2767443 RepID=UPI0019130771